MNVNHFYTLEKPWICSNTSRKLPRTIHKLHRFNQMNMTYLFLFFPLVMHGGKKVIRVLFFPIHLQCIYICYHSKKLYKHNHTKYKNFLGGKPKSEKNHLDFIQPKICTKTKITKSYQLKLSSLCQTSHAFSPYIFMMTQVLTFTPKLCFQHVHMF